jgi:hypothetical protein
MPMCQSSQISDPLLRANTLPANDNRLPVRAGIRSSRESSSTVKAARLTVLILCVTALLVL